MRLALAAALLLAGCKAPQGNSNGESDADLSAVRMAVQEGLGLLDCSRAAIRLQAGYEKEERRYRALIGQAEGLGLADEIEEWRRAYAAAMATADMACFPDRIATDLARVNDRLERALKEIG